MKDENKSVNDVIDHFNKIEGNAANLAQTDIRKLPKPLKFFGYIMLGFISLSILLIIIFNLLN